MEVNLNFVFAVVTLPINVAPYYTRSKSSEGSSSKGSPGKKSSKDSSGKKIPDPQSSIESMFNGQRI